MINPVTTPFVLHPANSKQGLITLDAALLGAAQSSATSVIAVCGEVIGGHKAVYSHTSNVFLANQSDIDHVRRYVGISSASGMPGDIIPIWVGGLVSEPSWAWMPGPVYLSNNGLLTQSVSSLSVIKQVGVALSATQLLIGSYPEILL